MLKSLKNKLKAAKREAQSQPREMAEIKAENQDLTAKLGTVQYTVHAYQKEANTLLQRIEGLNYEAAARNKLDAAKPKEETKAV